MKVERLISLNQDLKHGCPKASYLRELLLLSFYWTSGVSYSSGDGSSLFKRRPSTPQCGLDWNTLRTQHDTRRHQHQKKKVSICLLPESDQEEEGGDSPERSPKHDFSCPLRHESFEEDHERTSDKDSVDKTGKILPTEITSSHPCLHPRLSLNSLKPPCSCPELDKCNNNNNNNNIDADNLCNNRQGQGHGARHGSRRRKRRKKNPHETVIINVGGQIFETYRSTLRRLRCPVFNMKCDLELYYRKSSGDYFFDRDPTAFGSILNFLRTGELHIPTNMCGPALQNELDFWCIEEMDIARCCWTQYNTWKTQCRSLEKLEYDRKFSTTQQTNQVDAESSCWVRYRTKIWTFLQDPGSSRKAKAYAWVSIVFVFISIFSFCAETHPTFKVKAKDITQFAAFYKIFSLQPIQWSKLVQTTNQSSAARINHTNPVNSQHISAFAADLGNTSWTRSGSIRKRAIGRHNYGYICDTPSPFNDNNNNKKDDNDWGNKDLPHPALLIMDLICLIFFTLEYLTRFLCSPSKINFLRAHQNIVDFLAFAPDYVELMFLVTDHHQTEGVAIMEMLFILRILRLFRIFRLIRHVPGLWILLYTLKASFNELMLMCVFLLIGMVVFATLVHFVEPDGIFSNIPVGFWWSVVTMTTVGYGDMYPQSAAGFFIGSCCAVAGLLMIAFTVPIIVSNFVLYYTHVQYGLARRDKEIEKLREEEESELGRSRSRLDIERMGSIASMTPSVILHQVATPIQNGQSHVKNVFGTEFQARASFSSFRDLNLDVLSIEREGRTASTLSDPQSCAHLENLQLLQQL